MTDIKFRSLSAKSFMPFQQGFQIDFTGDKPLTAVYGDNESGKTSIFSALKWAWYGQALNRQGDAIRHRDLINYEQAALGHHTAEVKIEFDAFDQRYILERKVEARDGIVHPSGDADYTTSLYLEIDGIMQKSESVQEQLNNLIPEQVSRFFYFDAETLAEYEELLLDPDRQSRAIKKSIEDILGVQALRNTVGELDENHKNELAKLQNNQKAKDKYSSLLEQIKNAISLKEAIEKDILKVDEKLSSYTKELKDLEQFLQGQSETGELAEKRIRLDEKIRTYEEDLEIRKNELRKSVKDGWSLLLETQLKSHRNCLMNQISENEEKIKTVSSLSLLIEICKKTMSHSKCDHCGHMLNQKELETQQLQLDKYEQELVEAPEPSDPIVWQATLTTLNNIASKTPNFEDIQSKQLEVNSRVMDLEDSKVTRNEIIKELEGLSEDYYQEKNKRLKDVVALITKANSTLEASGEDLKNIEVDIAKFESQLKQTGDLETDKLLMSVKKRLFAKEVAERALEILIKNLKNQIESDASKLFRELATTEGFPNQRKLIINDNFGLSIELEDGRSSPPDSAGTSNIVALSLISALTKNAVRRPPIFLDTMAARIDGKRRKRIIENVNSLGNQVVILVHDGEIKKSDVSNWAPQFVNAEYDLKKISDTVSTLEKGI